MRRAVNVKLATLLAVIVLLALVVPAGAPGTVSAATDHPFCRFWGIVTVCGGDVEAGTEITVSLDPNPLVGPSWTTTTFSHFGVPYYVIDIPAHAAPEPGGVEGGTLYFTVTGVTYEGSFIPANLTGPDATWRRGTAVYNPLRVGTPGDANMDGVINAADIIRVMKIITGDEPATPCADANQDGVINAADIVRIMKIISGDA